MKASYLTNLRAKANNESSLFYSKKIEIYYWILNIIFYRKEYCIKNIYSINYDFIKDISKLKSSYKDILVLVWMRQVSIRIFFKFVWKVVDTNIQHILQFFTYRLLRLLLQKDEKIEEAHVHGQIITTIINPILNKIFMFNVEHFSLRIITQ